MAILDVNVKDELSFGFADRLKERGVPLVFLTGYDYHHFDGTYWQHAIRLQKPATIDQLRDALALAVARISKIGDRAAL